MSTISRLRSIKHLAVGDPCPSHGCCITKSLRHPSYAIFAEFYLFGIVLFMAFQFVGQFIMGDNVQRQLIGQFVLDSAFATNVFSVVLLILHLAQRFVSIRLSRYCDDPSRSG